MTQDTLNAALALASEGIRVCPIKRGTKGVHFLDHGLTQASSDPETIRTWWKIWPNPNIGAVGGAGFFFIDVDAYKGADISLLTMAAGLQQGALPRTRVVRTPRGGWHWYFRLPEGQAIKSKNDLFGSGSGIDVKGEGGYILAPPSVVVVDEATNAMKAYEVALGQEDAPIAVAPPELVAFLLEKMAPKQVVLATPSSTPVAGMAERVKRATAYLAHIPGAIAYSSGHQSAWMAALKVVRGFSLDEESAYNLLARDYNPRCKPPWDEKQLRHKITDALYKSNLPDGFLLNDERRAQASAPSLAPRLVTATDGHDKPTAAEPPPLRVRINGEVLTEEQWQKEIGELNEEFNALESWSVHGRKLRKNNFTAVHSALSLHPYWRGCIRHNLLTRRDECGPKENSNKVLTRARLWLEKTYLTEQSHESIKQAVRDIAEENSYHPVERYLSQLPPWDAVPRIGELLSLLGVPDEERALADAYMHRWMVGAVRRIFEPGCQMDYCLVLFGEQGARKSSFWRALGGDSPFCSGLAASGWKNPYKLHSSWIHELGELEGITTQKEVNEVKQHMSEVVDNFDAKWEVQASGWKRQFVFCGTTNRDDVLRDPTGARRFWIITTPHIEERPIDAEWIKTHRDMLWAEALHLYRAGHPSWMDTAELIASSRVQAEKFAPDEDPWTTKTLDFLTERGHARRPFKTTDVLSYIGIPMERWSLVEARRIGAILRKKNFKYQAVIIDERNVKGWRWPDLE